MNDWTTADAHGKRMNRARGAVSPDEAAQIEAREKAWTTPPERRVPISLDPRNFDAKVGITDDDLTDPTLERARRAFKSYGEKLKSWHEREATIYANQFETPAKKKMLASKMVHSELDKGAEIVDEAWQDVSREIKSINRQIDNAFRARLKADEAREIRQHLKAMSKSERRKFLANADDDVVASVLSAKPFLSGLNDAEANKIRHEATNKWFPDEVARKVKLEKALEILDSANARYFKEIPPLIDSDLPEYEKQQAATQQAVKGEL